MVTRCVGSHRYKVSCFTEGGHSFGNFGNTNAIAELSRLVGELYTVEVPKKENTKTTYNVGTISGGTSVNTIAQFAEMLYEYRSNDRECLAIMKKTFEEKIEAMRARVQSVCEKFSGIPCPETSGSTDCNSASSMGIPSVCLGVFIGGGMHTREEWIKKDSIATGLRIAAELILDNFNI